MVPRLLRLPVTVWQQLNRAKGGPGRLEKGSVMVVSTQSFIESVEKWAKAILENDFVAARRHARGLIMAGELLVIHPDFRRCFSRHCGDLSPHDALVHMCQILMCATDGRASVLNKFSQDDKRGG